MDIKFMLNLKNKSTMTKEEIMKAFTPKECATQWEFDAMMAEINDAQAKDLLPLEDRIEELNHKKTILQMQIRTLQLQMDAMKIDRLQVEQKRKEVNLAYHEVKNELVKLNPKEKFIKDATI